MTGPSPFQSSRISVDLEASGSVLTIGYTVDSRATHELVATFPADIDRLVGALDVVAASAAVYLGSLCLAREIIVKRTLPSGLLDRLAPIAEMLYDIRRWKDRLPLGNPPKLDARDGGPARPDARALDPRGAALLWSGGKDSTLALMTLEANGYDTHTVHVTANAGVELVEKQAVRMLAERLARPVPPTLEFEHADFLALSNAYATDWDDFPLANRVPFGRDLLLAALLTPFALVSNAARVCMGHDNECRNAYVEYDGKRFPRNDIESAEGAIALEHAIVEYAHPDLRMLPPVGALSEFRILRDMFTYHADLMADTAFCFWGSRCGRCSKCLRYYLADRLYAGDVLSFEACPLERDACPELADLLSVTPRSTLFQREVLVLLARLAQRGDMRREETMFGEFDATVRPGIEASLDEWEHELLATHDDPQVPVDFRPLHDGTLSERK
ncbi:MAG: Diphthamide synthase [Thermoleophilaceae bacterium]|jgi:7-cyano-7-deazaguanine synthase in queuosine biosynthesis|nr:Diphthamide synthase [Thermoleophilaceae bacterium]